MTFIQAPDLIITGLSKSFGEVKVLKGIDLTVRGGEFLGLMGPNGAGKSTLIKILDGIHTASSGEIRIGDDRVASLAGREDVGFIHQDLGLIDDLSVVENLRLGAEPLRWFGPLLDHSAERAAAETALEMVGLAVSVDAPVGSLSPGEKTLVAVARVFSRGASIVFVDESTSTLPPSEARRVIESLAEASARGATIVMVTHKLSEILDATRRVVVLLDGGVAVDQQTAGLDRAALVRMLVRHTEQNEDVSVTRSVADPGDVVLTMRAAIGGRAGPIDLVVREGEVLGLTGLPGSGLHDVAYLAAGQMVPASGTVSLVNGATRAIVPPHRETQGGFNDLSVRENLTISSLPRWRSKWRLLATGRERRDSEVMVKELNVRPPSADTVFGALSGGNKQKVIFGRTLSQKATLYVLCEPTRGVDVEARAEIYRLIAQLRAEKAAVLVVTSDYEDLVAVADRIAAVVEGGLKNIQDTHHMNIDELEEIL